MQEDDKSTVRGNSQCAQRDDSLGRWRAHSSSMYMHPGASDPKTCKSIEYVDYTKNLVSPAEDSVPFS
ncbi:hypothetical protein D623_10029816 [Myotis brandtii]|uniref:Uncharacterized protein n=1 Tax=Myotis brandtii TaxID=109478 RepID=S7MXC9_MYOBR|nr:hypothetical protein D623_10029816 [Myotis brandtii]